MGYLRILEQAPLQMTKVVNFEQASSLDHISDLTSQEQACIFRDNLDA